MVVSVINRIEREVRVGVDHPSLIITLVKPVNVVETLEKEKTRIASETALSSMIIAAPSTQSHNEVCAALQLMLTAIPVVGCRKNFHHLHVVALHPAADVGGIMQLLSKINESKKQHNIRYICLLILFLAIHFGIHVLADHIMHYEPPIDLSSFQVRASAMIRTVGLLYGPLVFWILLLWVRQRNTDHISFTQEVMGYLTTASGLFLIVSAQGLAFFTPKWLQQNWIELYATFYAIGWCFLLSGPLCFSAVRIAFAKIHLGVITFLIGLAWWFIISPILALLTWPSVYLTLVVYLTYILSLVVSLFGMLVSKNTECWMAFIGLLLLTIFFIAGKPSLVQYGPLLDPRFLIPLMLIGSLAWMSVIGRATGILKYLGWESLPTEMT